MSAVRFLVDAIIVLTVFGLIFFLYQAYAAQVLEYFFGNQQVAIFVRDVPVTVTVAEDQASRERGLSNLAALPDNEGMLFIFDREGAYYFWMKDMRFPIDILWIDDDMKIVHIEQNVRPESYPARYGTNRPARFVLEVNAFFVNTFNINLGDTITIPAHRLPPDLQS